MNETGTKKKRVMLLHLPQELFGAVVRSDFELWLVPLLSLLRALSRGARAMCAVVARELHGARLTKVLAAREALPHWLPAVRDASMHEWALHAMRLVRKGWGQRWSDALRHGNLRTLNEAAEMEEEMQRCFGLVSFVKDETFLDEAGAHFRTVVGKGEEMRHTSDKIFHVDLATVRALPGVDLDTCAALFYLQRGSRLLDAGSTWGLTDLVPRALSVQRRIIEIRDFALREQGCEDFSARLKARFGVTFTSKLHFDVCTLLTNYKTLVPDSRMGQDYQIGKLAGEFASSRRCVLQQFENKKAAAEVEKKLKACLPLKIMKDR